MAPMVTPAVAIHPSRLQPKDLEASEDLDKANLDLQDFVVQLSFDHGNGELNGTGFYVNFPGTKDDVILTAGHNLISEAGQRATDLTVLGNSPISIGADKFKISKSYEKEPNSKQAVNDYGIILVPRVNNQPRPGFGYSLKLGIDEDLNRTVHVTGYKGKVSKPVSKPGNSLGSTPSDKDKQDMNKPVDSTGKATSDGEQLVYGARTEQGMSGSPVWVAYNGYPTAVGIHNHRPEEKGKASKGGSRGTQINVKVLRDVCQWAGIGQFCKKLKVSQSGARPQGIYLHFSEGLPEARVRVGEESTSTFDVLPAYTKPTLTNTMPLYVFIFHQPSDWANEYKTGEWVRWQPKSQPPKVVLTNKLGDACLVRIAPGADVTPFRIVLDQSGGGKDLQGLRMKATKRSDEDVEDGLRDSSEISFGPDIKGLVVKFQNFCFE